MKVGESIEYEITNNVAWARNTTGQEVENWTQAERLVRD